MVAFNTVKPGDVLYDCHRVKMGNTTMSRMDTWTVHILEIDAPVERVWASWNSNPPRWWSRRWVEKLRRSPYKPRQPKPTPASSTPSFSEVG